MNNIYITQNKKEKLKDKIELQTEKKTRDEKIENIH